MPVPTIVGERAIVRKTLLRTGDLTPIVVDVVECLGDPRDSAFYVCPEISCAIWKVPERAATQWEAINFDLYIFVRAGRIIVEWSDRGSHGQSHNQGSEPSHGQIEADGDSKHALIVEKGSHYRIRFLEPDSEIITTSTPAALSENVQPLPADFKSPSGSRSGNETPRSWPSMPTGYSNNNKSTSRQSSSPPSWSDAAPKSGSDAPVAASQKEDVLKKKQPQAELTPSQFPSSSTATNRLHGSED